MIHHANIYTSQPSLLADSYEDFEREKVKEWYFFSPRVCKNGIRATRKAHLGFWRMSQSAKPIQHNGIDIGLKSVLNFHMESNKKSIKTEWIMHEYIIIDDNNDSNNSKNDFALCKIYKNSKKYKSNKDEGQQLQSEVLGAQNQQEELQTTDEQQQYYHHQQSQPQPQSQPFICNDHYQLQPQSESCSYNNVYNQPQSQLCTNEELLSHNDHYQLQLQQQQQPQTHTFIQQSDEESLSHNGQYQLQQQQLLIQQSDQSTNEELFSHNDHYQLQLQQQQQPETQTFIQQSDEEFLSRNGQYQLQQQ
ncbi:hypothetical protein F8388_022332 [Cannabis sativa]|uniref:NAC domain-containing protein n=1 Tax=Cannabis sativa TaxID=3483 RepID=A0A7J6G683_CANSA|nr:hypothetical protein F8388_018533 [Cannabis sativa]KAF4378511.1 hypothetical protein F8388_022332 [Cannabis sativa]